MQELRPTAPALGMMPDVPFTGEDFVLERGHTLFALTDGLAEARNPSGEVFGSDRVRAMVRDAAGAPAMELVRQHSLQQRACSQRRHRGRMMER